MAECDALTAALAQSMATLSARHADLAARGDELDALAEANSAMRGALATTLHSITLLSMQVTAAATVCTGGSACR